MHHQVTRSTDAAGATSLVIEVDGRLLPIGNNIVAVGRNYHDHASEQNVAPPETPLLFAKLASSRIACGDEIMWNPAVATLVDYEAELGVVIGRVTSRCRSTRRWSRSSATATSTTSRPRPPALRAASGCAASPHHVLSGRSVVVTADEIPDRRRSASACTVNGEVRQDATTADMISPIAEVIAYVSEVVTLLPGDLICTGTPGGVGMHRTPPQLLADGDEVVVEVEGLGRLVNRCRHLP